MSNGAKTTIFLFLALLFGFLPVHAQTKTIKNIGFIQDNIWYSKDPFFAEDRIRIYTTVINSSKYDFRGNLEFYANNDLLGKSSFSLVSGGFQVLWADWTAREGQKKIYARISDPRISLAGEKEEAVVLENAKTGEIETFVDKDTDKDGIGDKIDTDDDNDSISDAMEQKQGTNPLVKEIKETLQSGFIKEPEKSALEVTNQQKIAESAKGAISSINEFLDEQKNLAEAKKEEFKKRLGEGESLFEFDFGNLLGKKEKSPEEAINVSEDKNKNLLKLYVLALSALIFSLEYKAIIYLFGIYVIYRILKLFIKKLFF